MPQETQKTQSKVIPINSKIGEISEKGVRLFKFLRESIRENFRQIHTIDSYDEVLFLSKIPKKKECYCIAWQASGPEEPSETWIEVRKPKIPDPPALPEELKPWISEVDIHDSSLEWPEPHDTIAFEVPASELPLQEDPEQRVRYLKWNEQDDLRKIWETYVEIKWWPWRDLHNELKPIQDVYSELFTLYNRQLRLGESYEIVLGFGYLAWTSPQGQKIARHLITAQTTISLDKRNGVLSVTASTEGAKPQLETDMIPTELQPDPEQKQAIADQVTGSKARL